ncbi:YadA-like family protein [Advenella sp. WQ 585]|uniref:YadA-like family protein n=1 Tax=Advenella mandrilli TaxID=2800330 RepID=A0ABS1E9Y0_9BURK|nr:ESPR-type extended signal peptide-containing protein [Advenella mandrilli]MBK1779653.1 YadA-like family protein [Advenella mandrilli]
MNRIHKSIFNEQTGTYVAVSENTKNKGKSGRKLLAATALSAALGFGAMGSAQAQLVSACAGVSLPNSVITDVVVGDILYPVLTGLPVVGPLLGTLGVTDILDLVVAGEDITLNVLDTNGKLLSTDADCDTTADSYALNKEGGIAIGGNKISGLGSNGKEATASTESSIAFGNEAKALATGAIAIGEKAQALAAGAIAIGENSVANEVNTVSVGSAGNERKITNVKAGENLTDAVNVGQLDAAITNINTSGLVRQPNPADNITVGQETQGVAVDFSGSITTAQGPEAYDRKLIGVAAGDIGNADSNEAVTGGQLYTTNKYIADALGGGAEVKADGTLQAPEYELTYGTSGLAGAKHGDVGSVLGELAGHVGSNAVNIDNNTTNINKLLGGEVGIVKQDATTRDITVGAETDGTIVNFTNKTGDARTLTGLANGELKTGSMDAVTGDQLFSTNTNLDSTLAALGGGAEVKADGTVQAPEYVLDDGTNKGTTTTFNNVGGALTNLDGRVTANTGDIGTIKTDITNITKGSVGIVKQDATTRDITVGGETDGTIVNFTNKEGEVRTLTGLANGNLAAGSTDAVTGDQLFSTNTNLDSTLAALGGGAEVKADGTVQAPEYVLDDGTNKGTTITFNNVGGALTNLDGRVTSNTTNITNLMNGTAGLVQQVNDSASITVGAASGGTVVNFVNKDGDARTLTGLKEGDLSTTSTDAVTGKQLHATNVDLATALTALNAVDPITGGAIRPDYVLDDGTNKGNTTTVHTVGEAFENLDGRVTSNTSRITNIEGDLASIQNGTAGIVKQDATTRNITVGGETDGTIVDFTGTDGVRTLTGLKDGKLSATSSDAVTGKQLHATNQQVKATASALGGGAEAKDDGTFVNPLYALQEIQQDGSKKTVTFDNVGGALTSLNTSVASLQDQVNNNTSIGLVRQDSTTRVISVGGNTDGTEVNFANSNGEARVISGVAAGKGPTDAVNVQQAQEMISGATSTLRGEIRRAEKRADAGTAAATAVATLGQAYQPGQSAFSVGGGTWRGEAGYAVGLSTVSENGKWLLKGAVNGSGRGGAGGGASVTYLW